MPSTLRSTRYGTAADRPMAMTSGAGTPTARACSQAHASMPNSSRVPTFTIVVPASNTMWSSERWMTTRSDTSANRPIDAAASRTSITRRNSRRRAGFDIPLATGVMMSLRTRRAKRLEPAAAVASTACRMSWVAASGWDTNETCEAGTSTIVAFARSAMNRWSAGGIALSSVPSKYQHGTVSHAGAADGVAANAAAARAAVPRPSLRPSQDRHRRRRLRGTPRARGRGRRPRSRRGW